MLEDHQFHIAEKLLLSFVDAKSIKTDDRLVLNGLPRHVGQAASLDVLVNVCLVVYLECPDEVVYRRILTNSGGGRGGRIDDNPDAVAHKLEIFGKRTRPLLAYYTSKRVPIKRVEISQPTAPLEMVKNLFK